MITKIHKIYIDYEKEEKWINEMSAKGYQFTRYTFMTYFFEQGQPNEYVYRIELLDQFHNHPESRAYLAFLEGMGIDCVGTWFRWVFLRKKASAEPFELYTDNPSKIKHFKGILTLLMVLLLLNVSALTLNLSIGLAADVALNLMSTSLNGLVVLFLAPLAYKTYKKIQALQKEGQISE